MKLPGNASLFHSMCKHSLQGVILASLDMPETLNCFHLHLEHIPFSFKSNAMLNPSGLKLNFNNTQEELFI